MTNERLGQLLLNAIQDGIPVSGIKSIIASGASVNYCQVADNWTAVHVAAQYGRKEILLMLISHGADVNTKSVDLVSPLHAAALAKHRECMEVLIRAGAEVNARNIDGSTPLCDASASGSLQCIQLLVENGASVNPKIVRTPPLHESCLSGSPDCVRYLIKHGVAMNATDDHYGTALHASCSRGNFHAAKVLLEFGVEPDPQRLYKTPLHLACVGGHFECVKLLAEFGANPYREDWRGQNAFNVCTSVECLDFLTMFYSSPRSLMELCWLTLRSKLGPAIQETVIDFDIPFSLKAFLQRGPYRLW